MAVLSSREDQTSGDELLEQLQELVFMANDIANIADDPADEVEDLLEQLEAALFVLADTIEENQVEIRGMANDLISLASHNHTLALELKRCAQLLIALSAPPTDEEVLDRALQVLRREGNAQIKSVEDESNDSGILLEVELTFREEELREAFRLAILEYNNALPNKLLAP